MDKYQKAMLAIETLQLIVDRYRCGGVVVRKIEDQATIMPKEVVAVEDIQIEIGRLIRLAGSAASE